MGMERLIVPIEWKAAADDSGVLEGYLSTFGNVDLGYDVVVKGAFDKTIAKIKSEGIPLLADHVASTASVLGTIFDAAPDDRGLKIKARFSSAPSAQDVRIKLLEGHLGKMSMGYEATKYAFEEQDGVTVRLLQEVKLWEGSVVVMPMNPEAVVSRVKSIADSLDPAARFALVAELAKKETANEMRERLDAIVREAYGAEGIDIWVRDFDDSKVWFHVMSADESDTYEQAYEEADGSLSLTGDRVKVRPVTTYVAEDKSATLTDNPSGVQLGDELSEGGADDAPHDQAGDEPADGAADEGAHWDRWASEAILAGHDPAEIADPAALAGMRTALQLMEDSLGALTAPTHPDIRAGLAAHLQQTEAAIRASQDAVPSDQRTDMVTDLTRLENESQLGSRAD